jgi:uncharacterized protein YlxP (DUF503 family)
MFVCVARLRLDIPAAASLKDKRQVVRRVTDRIQARFNTAIAEVDEQDTWQRATLALAVVSAEKRHAQEQMDKIIHFVEEMYVAPLISRETELLSFGDQLFAEGAAEAHNGGAVPLTIPKGERSLAEAEGLGQWEHRHKAVTPPPRTASSDAVPKLGGKTPKQLSLEEARARARQLRNRREWEK